MTEIQLPLDPYASEYSPLDRWVIYSALIAQVDDVHAGGVYQWTEEHLASARSLLAELSGTPLGEDPESYGESLSSKVIIRSLLIPVYDLDHPEFTPEEWTEAERLIAAMEPEFGR